jgi:hypothetical protein
MYDFRYCTIRLSQNEIFDGLVASVIHVKDNVPIHVRYYTTFKIDPISRHVRKRNLWWRRLRSRQSLLSQAQNLRHRCDYACFQVIASEHLLVARVYRVCVGFLMKNARVYQCSETKKERHCCGTNPTDWPLIVINISVYHKS